MTDPHVPQPQPDGEPLTDSQWTAPTGPPYAAIYDPLGAGTPDIPRAAITPLIRSITMIVLVLVAVIVTLTMAPVTYIARDATNDIEAALADDSANNARTTGAPQQTVVNGWTAKDLLTITAKELNVVAANSAQRDDRPAILLRIAIMAIAVLGIDFDRLLRRSRTPRSDRPAPASSV